MNRAFQHPQALEQLESTHLECCDIALTHGPLSSLVKRKAQPAIGQMLARLRQGLSVCAAGWCHFVCVLELKGRGIHDFVSSLHRS